MNFIRTTHQQTTVTKKQRTISIIDVHNIIEKFPEKDVSILKGDLNAKIGSKIWSACTGNHGLNGERFADTRALNNLQLWAT